MASPQLSAILVHVDGGPGAAKRIALAGGLADRFGARLIGGAAGQFVVPVYAPFGEGFVAMPYMFPDPIVARQLEDAGAACVIEAEHLCLLLGEDRRGDERVITQAFAG